MIIKNAMVGFALSVWAVGMVGLLVHAALVYLVPHTIGFHARLRAYRFLVNWWFAAIGILIGATLVGFIGAMQP